MFIVKYISLFKKHVLSKTRENQHKSKIYNFMRKKTKIKKHICKGMTEKNFY